MAVYGFLMALTVIFLSFSSIKKCGSEKCFKVLVIGMQLLFIGAFITNSIAAKGLVSDDLPRILNHNFSELKLLTEKNCYEYPLVGRGMDDFWAIVNSYEEVDTFTKTTLALGTILALAKIVAAIFFYISSR